MSLFEYEESKRISATDPGFYALIMAAMRKADDSNLERLKFGYPQTYRELRARFNAPDGLLPEETKKRDRA